MSCRNKRSLNNIKKKKVSENFNQVYSICLICGRQGQHDVPINSSTYLSCSGTQLTKFLIKIIGEEPCYSLSRLMCHQCFLLLDRLDTYQSRAAEISSYISSRYKETKFELLGNRQTISELIVNTLSNIKNFKSGTTLNVCDELSVTVFRENLQRKEPKNQTCTLLKTGDASSNNNDNNNCENYIKFKRKRTSLLMQKDSVKKQKLTFANNNNNNNNNNNLIENKSVVCDNVESEHPAVHSVHNYNGSECSESDCESNHSEKSKGDGSDSSSGNSVSTPSKGKELTNNSKSSSGSNSSVSSSGSSSSSSSDSNSSSSDDSSDEEDNKVANKVNGSVEKSKQDELKKKTDFQCKIKEESSIETEIKVKEEIENETEPEKKHTFKPNQESENLNGKEEMRAIESHLAEAVLAQGSLASNLFQSFLSTSLWMSSSSSDSASHPNFSSLPVQQQKQIAMMQNENNTEDDMTVESLNSAAALSINDKQKRLELKNTGQSYVNTKGKLIEAKRVWPQDCSRCPLRCNDRLSKDTRQTIFSSYWELGSYERQREHLALHMEREERIGKSGLTRTVVLYFLTYNMRKHQVCRQFFLKTLDVSEKASRIVLEKKLKGELGVEAPQQHRSDNENSDLSS